MPAKNEQVVSQSAEELLCPIRHLMNIFGGKWKLPIVCMLSGGTPLRYSTIKRRLCDITNVMLAQSLKELEAEGIIHREQYNEVPPRVEYTLTEKGTSVLPALGQLAEWAIGTMECETRLGVLCTKCQSTT
ncbi:helix-turn-helix domain-containing protein [Dehalobacter sp.]|jgi:DNA-binding HxlR family transcriptional regulator|uniref:winged helix-turn-helix transcriptional regulator n=1 Tax=Dehalobacter sp. TaxID=1962289 RepID=UPI0003637EC4|nr:helix-turn-helix domain-containing protein [Dehalobacter sp.]MCG1025411.1 winged helix-turn-helix transcriptional regulator [Dehalobacter sp.]